jgi:hypothetical protein
MKNKTYTPSGFIWEICIELGKKPEPQQAWNAAFGDINHTAVIDALIAEIEADGFASSESYLARPVGRESHRANTEMWKKRELRFPISKMVAFAERAGFNLSQII